MRHRQRLPEIIIALAPRQKKHTKLLPMFFPLGVVVRFRAVVAEDTTPRSSGQQLLIVIVIMIIIIIIIIIITVTVVLLPGQKKLGTQVVVVFGIMIQTTFSDIARYEYIASAKMTARFARSYVIDVWNHGMLLLQVTKKMCSAEFADIF